VRVVTEIEECYFSVGKVVHCFRLDDATMNVANLISCADFSRIDDSLQLSDWGSVFESKVAAGCFAEPCCEIEPRNSAAALLAHNHL
jgi:hypothetical protein